MHCQLLLARLLGVGQGAVVSSDAAAGWDRKHSSVIGALCTPLRLSAAMMLHYTLIESSDGLRLQSAPSSHSPPLQVHKKARWGEGTATLRADKSLVMPQQQCAQGWSQANGLGVAVLLSK